jgi:hypothetical protein
MVSLSDIFDTSFFVLLGILILSISLLFIYYESKMREQNHKINSMLSLVSSLAEETGNLRNRLSMYVINGTNGINNIEQYKPNLDNSNENGENDEENDNELILVSDDEDSDNELESNGENSDSDTDSDTDSHTSTHKSYEKNNKDDIKVLQLNLNNTINDSSESDNNDDINDSDDDLDDLNDDTISLVPNDTNADISSHILLMEHLDSNANTNNSNDEPMTLKNEITDLAENDLKSINIHSVILEDDKMHEPLDYKKLPLPKLRTLVTEKGLVADTSKLKKNELLKLLGIE